jgi:hypothetical protein
MSDVDQGFERIRVIVETAERSFRGYISRPVDASVRFSDYLNNYDRPFIALSDVAVNDRGQTHRPGESHQFVAIATDAITFIAPLKENERY